ncbi:MAG: hypothetical protein ACRDYC_05615 [Acidimicrobiales bacterium]
MAPTPPATTPATVNAAAVATDILKFGGLAVGILELVENTASFHLSGGAQAIIAAIVTVVTGIMSVFKERQVVAAATGAK